MYGEPFLRTLRNAMHAAGMPVESSKGEAWPGQHELNFRYADALTTADNHALYKNGAKELAQQHGCSITFMAKPDHTWIGSSCHIHSSLWRRGDGGLESAFAGETAEFKGWLAGQIACFGELAIFWNADYRPGVYGVAAFYLVALIYFAVAGRHRLVLSPEEEFALSHGAHAHIAGGLEAQMDDVPPDVQEAHHRD